MCACNSPSHFSINLQFIAASAVNKIDSRRALCMCESQLTCVQGEANLHLN